MEGNAFNRITAVSHVVNVDRLYMISRLIIGVLAGAGLGFGWYKLVGCSTGTCPLTSNPVISTLYGAGLGLLLAASSH